VVRAELVAFVRTYAGMFGVTSLIAASPPPAGSSPASPPAAHAAAAPPAAVAPPERLVIVVDEALAPGLAANAAAVVAFTLGAQLPDLRGPDVADADGGVLPGLIPVGLPILRAPADALTRLHAGAVEAGLGVVAMPMFGHQTNDYDEFRALVARTPRADLRFLAVAVHGPRRSVGRLTGSFGLLR
jgi:Protein of unknown function (DUF2000)